METVFYVVGIALVVIALVISALGMRSDNFPSPAVMRIGIVFVALVVAGTVYSAVQASEDEQATRLEEENLQADAEEAAATAEDEATGNGEIPNPADQGEGPKKPQEGTNQGGDTPAGASTASGDGAQVFVDNGCGSCHTLAAQGDAALGTIGPNLDEALVDKDAAFIETSIVDPSADVETGFGDGIMPADFGSTISPDDLQALVAYLQESTSGSAK